MMLSIVHKSHDVILGHHRKLKQNKTAVDRKQVVSNRHTSNVSKENELFAATLAIAISNAAIPDLRRSF